HTPGLLGYALRAHICTRQFWTLSAWEGEVALQQFVGEQPHGHVMMALRGKMAQSHLLGLLQAAFGAAPPRAGARSSMMPHHWQTGRPPASKAQSSYSFANRCLFVGELRHRLRSLSGISDIFRSSGVRVGGTAAC